MDNRWLNYSVLGLSFRVALVLGIFFPRFVFKCKYGCRPPLPSPLQLVAIPVQTKSAEPLLWRAAGAGPGRVAPPSTARPGPAKHSPAGRLCLLRLHTPGWPPAGQRELGPACPSGAGAGGRSWTRFQGTGIS